VEKPREYELTCVFNVKEDHYPTGLEAVKKILTGFNYQIVKDEDRGNRELAYLINDEDRGHYHLFTFSAQNDGFTKLDEQLKLQAGLLRYLIIKLEAPSKKKPRKPKVKAEEKTTGEV